LQANLGEHLIKSFKGAARGLKLFDCNFAVGLVDQIQALGDSGEGWLSKLGGAAKTFDRSVSRVLRGRASMMNAVVRVAVAEDQGNYNQVLDRCYNVWELSKLGENSRIITGTVTLEEYPEFVILDDTVYVESNILNQYHNDFPTVGDVMTVEASLKENEWKADAIISASYAGDAMEVKHAPGPECISITNASALFEKAIMVGLVTLCAANTHQQQQGFSQQTEGFSLVLPANLYNRYFLHSKMFAWFELSKDRAKRAQEEIRWFFTTMRAIHDDELQRGYSPVGEVPGTNSLAHCSRWMVVLACFVVNHWTRRCVLDEEFVAAILSDLRHFSEPFMSPGREGKKLFECLALANATVNMDAFILDSLSLISQQNSQGKQGGEDTSEDNATMGSNPAIDAPFILIEKHTFQVSKSKQKKKKSKNKKQTEPPPGVGEGVPSESLVVTQAVFNQLQPLEVANQAPKPLPPAPPGFSAPQLPAPRPRELERGVKERLQAQRFEELLVTLVQETSHNALVQTRIGAMTMLGPVIAPARRAATDIQSVCRTLSQRRSEMNVRTHNIAAYKTMLEQQCGYNHVGQYWIPSFIDSCCSICGQNHYGDGLAVPDPDPADTDPVHVQRMAEYEEFYQFYTYAVCPLLVDLDVFSIQVTELIAKAKATSGLPPNTVSVLTEAGLEGIQARDWIMNHVFGTIQNRLWLLEMSNLQHTVNDVKWRMDMLYATYSQVNSLLAHPAHSSEESILQSGFSDAIKGAEELLVEDLAEEMDLQVEDVGNRKKWKRKSGKRR